MCFSAIASDIVFIPGSDVIDSSEDQRQPMSHQDNSSQGNRTLSSTSDDEEERDSPPSVDSSYDDVSVHVRGSFKCLLKWNLIIFI